MNTILNVYTEQTGLMLWKGSIPYSWGVGGGGVGRSEYLFSRTIILISTPGTNHHLAKDEEEQAARHSCGWLQHIHPCQWPYSRFESQPMALLQANAL